MEPTTEPNFAVVEAAPFTSVVDVAGNVRLVDHTDDITSSGDDDAPKSR